MAFAIAAIAYFNFRGVSHVSCVLLRASRCGLTLSLFDSLKDLSRVLRSLQFKLRRISPRASSILPLSAQLFSTSPCKCIIHALFVLAIGSNLCLRILQQFHDLLCWKSRATPINANRPPQLRCGPQMSTKHEPLMWFCNDTTVDTENVH